MTDYEKTEQIKSIIQGLLDRMGVQARVEFEDSLLKGLVFNISSPESRSLIGHQGATLHSLEILAHAMAARLFKGQPPIFFSLDVDDYKRKREWSLKEKAREAAGSVHRTGKPFAFEPMPNYERRLIHAYIQENHPEVVSRSDGRDPYRRIVLSPK
jgi:spoIIIJ-associated protein